MRKEKTKLIYLPKWTYCILWIPNLILFLFVMLAVIIEKEPVYLLGSVVLAIITLYVQFIVQICYKLAYMYKASKGWAIWMALIFSGFIWLIVYWAYIKIRYAAFDEVKPEKVRI